MRERNPCLDCGACCSAYRVAFYWAEADDAPGGVVPAALTTPLSPFKRCMKGTDTYAPRCIALQGDVGGPVHCSIYESRPSPCREVHAGDDFCRRARARFGLPPLPDTATVRGMPDHAAVVSIRTSSGKRVP